MINVEKLVRVYIQNIKKNFGRVIVILFKNRMPFINKTNINNNALQFRFSVNIQEINNIINLMCKKTINLVITGIQYFLKKVLKKLKNFIKKNNNNISYKRISEKKNIFSLYLCVQVF